MKTLRLGGICSDFTCAKCCQETAMLLSNKDIQNIEKLGFKKEDFSEIDENGLTKLVNIDGSCFFLKDNKCTIYEHRPQGCRFYPIIYDIDYKKAVLDDECPLIDNISSKLVLSFSKDIKKFIEGLLKE